MTKTENQPNVKGLQKNATGMFDTLSNIHKEAERQYGKGSEEVKNFAKKITDLSEPVLKRVNEFTEE